MLGASATAMTTNIHASISGSVVMVRIFRDRSVSVGFTGKTVVFGLVLGQCRVEAEAAKAELSRILFEPTLALFG